MFCSKCGKQFEGDGLICPECAAQPVSAPEAQPAAAEENLVLTNPEAPAPKKKLSKGAIIAICLAAVAVVGILIAVFFGESIVNLFRSPEDQMIKLEKEQVKTLSNMFRADKSRQPMKTDAALEYHVLINEDFLTGFSSGITGGEMPAMDLSFLSDILMRVDASMSGDQVSAILGFGLGNTNVLTVNMLMDAATGELWWQIPELSETYVYLGQEDLAAEGGAVIISPAISSPAQSLLLELLASEEAATLIDRYGNIILNGIDEVERSTKTIEVDGISQKLTLLTAKITEEDVYSIAIDILETAKTDKELEALMDSLGEAINAQYADNEYYEEVDLHQEMLSSIDEDLAELEELKANADSPNYILLTDYVDGDEIVGRKLSSSTGETLVYYVTVRKGDNFAFEADLAQQISITGSGTEEDDVYDGDFEVRADGQRLMKLEVSNFYADDEKVSGKLTLKPSAAVYTQMGMDTETAIMMQAMLGLAVELDAEGEDAFISLGIELSGMNMISITGQTAEANPVNLIVPADYINMLDEGSEDAWIASFDTSKLIANLEKAGVPSELIDSMMQAMEETP